MEGACEDLRQRFVGENADNIQDIWQNAYMARFYRGGPVLMVLIMPHQSMFVSQMDHLTDSIECFVWARYSPVGYQRQEARGPRLAASRRQGARPRQGVWLDRRRQTRRCPCCRDDAKIARIHRCEDECHWYVVVLSQIAIPSTNLPIESVAWIDSPDALKGTVERVRQVKCVVSSVLSVLSS